MPHEIVGEVIGQVVVEAAGEATEQVHRRFGWKGCLFLFLAVAGIGAMIAWHLGAF